jgi:plasmid stability protein
MTSITIHKLDPIVKERLRIRAAEHGHSMEAEAREILKDGLGTASSEEIVAEFFKRIHDRFAALGGVDLELPSRDDDREPPKFD